MRQELTELDFNGLKAVADDIIELLNQSERQILVDLINQTENDSTNISWLRIYLSDCLAKSGL